MDSWVDDFLLFFCASFFPFFLPCPPHPSGQFSSPKCPLSGTSDLLFLVEKIQPAGAGFGDGSGRGRPTGKKGKSFFLWRARKKVRSKLRQMRTNAKSKNYTVTLRHAETTTLIKVAFWRRSGRGEIEGKVSMTTKFGLSEKFKAGKSNQLNVLWPKMAGFPVFLTPKIPQQKFMWVPYLRSFPGSEAHTLFLGAHNGGGLGSVQKVYVEKVYVIFRPLTSSGRIKRAPNRGYRFVSPPFPERNLPFSSTGNHPPSVGSPTISAGSPV